MNDVMVATVTAAAGLWMFGAGTWALAVQTGGDVGALQLAIGLGLLLALLWRDAVATMLAAGAAGTVGRAVVHAVDAGARPFEPWLLGGAAAALVFALVLRLRRLGFVLGPVRAATTAALAPFVEQKTVALTTYRRSGKPVSTAVSLAVDGDRAVFRSFERAGKVRRLRAGATVEIAPATWRGTPTGPGIRGRARLLEGRAADDAARLLRRKHPLLHGVLVPLTHRMGRNRVGRTVHAELVPLTDPTHATESADRTAH